MQRERVRKRKEWNSWGRERNKGYVKETGKNGKWKKEEERGGREIGDHTCNPTMKEWLSDRKKERKV